MKKLRITINPEDQILISYLLGCFGGTQENYKDNLRLYLDEDSVLKSFKTLDNFKRFCNGLSSCKTVLSFSRVRINPSGLSMNQFAELLFNSTLEPMSKFEKKVYSQAKEALVYATRFDEYQILLDKEGNYQDL